MMFGKSSLISLLRASSPFLLSLFIVVAYPTFCKMQQSQSVIHTINMYPYTQKEAPSNSLALSLNIQFVMLHGYVVPEAAEYVLVYNLLITLIKNVLCLLAFLIIRNLGSFVLSSFVICCSFSLCSKCCYLFKQHFCQIVCI